MINKNDVHGLMTSMGVENVPSKEEQDAKALKERKKQFEAYLQVATHMFGRPPSLDEIIGMMSHASPNGSIVAEKASNEVSKEKMQESAPEASTVEFKHAQEPMNKALTEQSPNMGIMSTNVFYGRNKDKQPDPKSILFYEHPNGVYSVGENKWLDGRPNVLDHLDSRPIMHNSYDINHYILHGLMDDHEYDMLNDMLPDDCKKMWDLKKNIEENTKLIQEESEHGANIHAQLMETEFDLKQLLVIIEQLQDEKKQMLDILKQNGLGQQFMTEEELNPPPAPETPNEVFDSQEIIGQPGLTSPTEV